MLFSHFLVLIFALIGFAFIGGACGVKGKPRAPDQLPQIGQGLLYDFTQKKSGETVIPIAPQKEAEGPLESQGKDLAQ